MPIEQNRRRFLSLLGAAGAAGVGGLAGVRFGSGVSSMAAEPPPEVTTITLEKAPTTCLSPQYMAGDLLRAEGFTEIRYQPIDRRRRHRPWRITIGLGHGFRTGNHRGC